MLRSTRHANEHLATSDKGVAMFRRRLRADMRAVAAGGSPYQASNEVAAPLPTYAGDTVLRISAPPGDDEFIGGVCRQVAQTLTSADALRGPERDAQVIRELRAIEHPMPGAAD